MPPLQAWRNERVVYERSASSRTPTVVAVEVDMARSTKELNLPALQLPLPQIEATEFPGISTAKMTSKVYALPLQKTTTRTLDLKGPGVIHVLDGCLRYAREGEKCEKLAKAGSTILLRSAESQLVAPADREGDRGVRFCWVAVS